MRKVFPPLPHSVQYTYHYDEKYTHPAACTLLFIFDNISFLQQCPAPFFIIFSSTKSTTMLNELKGNSSTATLQRFSLLSPSSLLSKYRDENLMIMVGRWKALKNVKAEIVFQSRINWLGHMTLGTKEDCLGNISISICRLKKAGFLSFLLVWLNLKSLPRPKWPLFMKASLYSFIWCSTVQICILFVLLLPSCICFCTFVPSSSSLHSVDQRNGSNIPGLVTITSFFWLCSNNWWASWA